MRVMNEKHQKELFFRELNEYMNKAVFINICDEFLTLPEAGAINLIRSRQRSSTANNRLKIFTESPRDKKYGCLMQKNRALTI
ncbi:MAG: hypothetical protein RBU23_11065 [Candidatus Auribacterota bacterium]|jgi:hypothetical protein|nr:hypothetical protein [Candidatus Auribacterota bacterium]